MAKTRPQKQAENSKQAIESEIENPHGLLARGHEHELKHQREREHDRELPRDDGNLSCPACDRSGLIATGYRELQCSTCGHVVMEEGGHR